MHRSARFFVAVSLFCLLALAGCRGGGARSVVPAGVVAASSSAVVPLPTSAVLTIVPSAALPAAVEPVVSSSVPSTSLLPTSALLAEDQHDLASAAFDHDNLEATSLVSKAAVDFVRALIASKRSRAAAFVDEHSLALIDDWADSLGSMPDARVIDAVVLGTASSRSIVAVSIASPMSADGLVSEPIAYLVELSESADGTWLVTGMTFA
jgi:hypothetical protein